MMKIFLQASLLSAVAFSVAAHAEQFTVEVAVGASSKNIPPVFSASMPLTDNGQPAHANKEESRRVFGGSEVVTGTKIDVAMLRRVGERVEVDIKLQRDFIVGRAQLDAEGGNGTCFSNEWAAPNAVPVHGAFKQRVIVSPGKVSTFKLESGCDLTVEIKRL